HNLAVNYLMLALEETAKHLAGTLTKTNVTRLENTWKNADRRWGEVADSEHIWDETKKRILSKDDPALTAALADQMKADLRKTLSAIHGDIARHYAEKGMLEHAKFHVDAMPGDSGVDDSYRATIREVTKPVRDRLEAARTQAQSHANSPDEGKKKQAFAKARDFFETDFEQKAKPVLELFYAGDKVDSVLKKEKEGIYDEVAETVLSCCVKAYNAKQRAGESTDNDTTLLKKARAIATDPELIKRIEKNMSDGSGGDISGPAEVQAAMLSVLKDKDTVKASERFRRLQRVRPKLKEWATKHSGEEASKTQLKMFAMLERALSVEIFNKEDNIDLAITAVECAIEDTPDATDRKKFQSDLDMLIRIRKNRGGGGGGGGDNDLKQILLTVAEVSKSREKASLRLRKLLGVRPKLKIWAAKHSGSSESKQMLKMFAMLERSLSVDIVNNEVVALLKSRDIREAKELIALALLAINNAIEDTTDDDDRKNFRKNRKDLDEIIKTVGGNPPPPPPPPPPKPPKKSSKRMMWTCLLGVSALLLSFIFGHYLPAGWSVGEMVVQWWHLALGGTVLGFIFPWGKLPYPLPPLFKAFTIWGIVSTALVMTIVVAYTGFHPGVFRAWLWCAAIIGFTVSAMMIGPYWVLLFVSQHAAMPTSPVRGSSVRRMPLFYIGVMFGLFAFSKDHIPMLANLPMLQWWHFPIFGVVLAFFVPARTYRSSFFLQFYFLTTWPMTLLAWLGLLVYNAIAPEASAVSKCWAPYIGMALGYLTLIFRLERIPISLARMEKRMK
ncbi:MAG: hypothetical protein LBM04_10145, partial [Opitutaceae bacterium]|nr:hypothetical protein [Opitutaceae bacterium]